MPPLAHSLSSSAFIAFSFRDPRAVLRQVELCQRVECRCSEGRQPDEVGFVLLGEVPIQPVGCLDEAVVQTIGSDQRRRQPAPHRRVIVDLVTEVPPLGMRPQLLIRQSQRPVHLVGVCMDPDTRRGRAR